MEKDLTEIFSGFSKLNKEERFQRLLEVGALSDEEVRYLRGGGLRETSLGENLIENVIGYFQIPLGVATNFQIDGKDLFVPMAVEETSIVAAASKTAKWVRESGKITTKMLGKTILGQIQVNRILDFENFERIVLSQKRNWIESANRDIASGLVARGGGVIDLGVRRVEDMAIIHVEMDPCDAMGANIINQVCEYLRKPISETTGEVVSMCILSNLVDTKLTEAVVEIDNIEANLGMKIEEASRFAERDPYRAATHNKGVLNGIDPILIATGNDWRAVEAGVHAYAARSGKYRSISTWRYLENGKLVGRLEAPIVVGTVGGVTGLHPTARLCLRMLGCERATDLSRICAAVGLVQNLGALRALTTVGIIEGHMKLHIKNLTLGAGANERELPLVAKKLEQILSIQKKISLSHAIEALKEVRGSLLQ